MTEQGGWNELLPFMMTCIQSQNARLMEMALLVFANLGDVVSQLAAYLPTLHDVSCNCTHMAPGFAGRSCWMTVSVLPSCDAWRPSYATSNGWLAELSLKLKPWPADTSAGRQGGRQLHL